MNPTVQLKTWTQTYLKNRDAMHQAIISFEDKNGDFIVHKKTGDTLFLIRPEPKDIKEILAHLNGNTSLVLLNTKQNLTFVCLNWDQLAKYEKLCLYFVNPTVNQKWLLYPHTHNQITERIALKRGLETMYAEVAPYT